MNFIFLFLMSISFNILATESVNWKLTSKRYYMDVDSLSSPECPNDILIKHKEQGRLDYRPSVLMLTEFLSQEDGVEDLPSMANTNGSYTESYLYDGLFAESKENHNQIVSIWGRKNEDLVIEKSLKVIFSVLSVFSTNKSPKDIEIKFDLYKINTPLKRIKCSYIAYHD